MDARTHRHLAARARVLKALAHPARPVVLVGSQDPDRLAAATAALDVPLARTDAYAIVAASEGRPLP